ncbi:MAG: prepilin-type N-terminal cleavage/methylation domain-containing protein [Planctomycetota bacterium]|jgi:prepilin-type N-terminal cleavage/methylation domain-containing protein
MPPDFVARHRCRPAFTLIEVIVVVTIIAVIMSIVLPKFNDDTKLRLMAAAAILRSDIEYAQVLTISNPKDPVLVRIDASQHEYWLAKVSSDATPIPRPGNGDPYYIKFGDGRAATTGPMDIALVDIDSEKLIFSTYGGVLDPTKSPVIKLTQNKHWVKIYVATTTGTLTEEYGEDP